jgi:hypothetical protein
MTDTANATPTERLRRRTAAAEYIQSEWSIPCSPKTLAKLAVIGGGPEFRKAGRTPLYPEDGLDDWALRKIGPRVRSTSELPKAQPCQRSRPRKQRVPTEADTIGP